MSVLAFRPLGRLVDVGGYRLHLRCEGQGSPTVVLESGSGLTSNEWTLAQPEVAKFTRVCSYHRAGSSNRVAEHERVVRLELFLGARVGIDRRKTLVPA